VIDSSESSGYTGKSNLHYDWFVGVLYSPTYFFLRLVGDFDSPTFLPTCSVGNTQTGNWTLSSIPMLR